MKTADTVFYIPPGSKSFWTNSIYEPLIIPFVIPFREEYPWQVRRSKGILELERKPREVWGTSEGSERSVLCEFWSASGT